MARTPSSKVSASAPKTPKGRTTSNIAKPYSDDKNRGRRTGKVFKEAGRDSDGFEDFDEMLALNESPRSARLKSRTPVSAFLPDDSATSDEDDDQEQDMSIAVDSSGPDPSSYVPRDTQPISSQASNLSRSISRRSGVSRTLEMDSIPSPAARGLARPAAKPIIPKALSNQRERPKPTPKARPPRPPTPASDSDDDVPIVASQEREGSVDLGSAATPVKPASVRSASSRQAKPVSSSSTSKKRKSYSDDEDEYDAALHPRQPSPTGSRVSKPPSKSRRSISPVSKKPKSTSSVRSSSRREAAPEDDDEPASQAREDTSSPPRAGRSASSVVPQSRPLFRSPSLSPVVAKPPSKAKTPVRAPSMDDDSDNEPDFGGGFEDQGPMDLDLGGGYDDNVGDEPMDEDPPEPPESDHDEEEELPVPKKQKALQAEKTDKKKKPKSTSVVNDKSRSRSQLSPVVEEDEEQADRDVEDDIARGLENVPEEDEADDSDRDREEQPTMPKKKPKVKKVKESKEKKENRSPAQPKKKKPPVLNSSMLGHLTMGERSTTAEPDIERGIRRSTRRRHAPLEYWRGERIILGRSDNEASLVPVLKGFLELPRETPEPLGKHRRKSRKKFIPRGPGATERSTEVRNWTEDSPPEAGMDDNTPEEIDAIDWKTEELAPRRLLVPEKGLNPRQPNSKLPEKYLYEKVFTDGQFLAGGVLRLPIKGNKAIRPSKDNTYLFFVHRGAVKLTMNGKEYVLAQGGTFMVPRGNLYGLDNVAERETVIFFSQGREHMSDDEEEEEDEEGAAITKSPSKKRLSATKNSLVPVVAIPNVRLGAGAGAGGAGASKGVSKGRKGAPSSPAKRGLSVKNANQARNR